MSFYNSGKKTVKTLPTVVCKLKKIHCIPSSGDDTLHKDADNNIKLV